MTSSFGITPQRQLRDYTAQPEKPAALPKPAEPATEPQRVGGQLIDARSFQQDVTTAQTLKSIEQFLGDQGVFAKESAAYFERYKEQKKEEALNLYKQEALAYQQSIENSKDVKALEKKGDSELATQLRVTNPWTNFFYYTLKAEDASNDVGYNLAAWGENNLDDLAKTKDPAARKAAIALQAKKFLEPYQDLPAAFITGKIDPVIASVQSKLSAKVVERSFELKNLEIIDVSRQHLRNGIAQVAKAAQARDQSGVVRAQGQLEGIFRQTLGYLEEVHGYKERKGTEVIAAALDKLWIDENNDGLNDIGNFLTGDTVVAALAKVKTKDGISLSELVYDDKGSTIGALVQDQYADALGKDEKRSTAMQASITRQAKDWGRKYEEEAYQWQLQNPNATPEQINARIKERSDFVMSDRNERLLSDKSLPEIQEFFKKIYTPMEELVTPGQMADDQTFADDLNRQGKPFPREFLNNLRGKPYAAELIIANAKAVGDAKDKTTQLTRAKLLTDLKNALKDRFLTSDAMRAISSESSDTREQKKRYTNSAVIQANRYLDVIGAKEVNDAVYEARQNGLDLRDPKVVDDIFRRLNDKLSKQEQFNNPEFYYNLGSDNKKVFGAPSNRVPSVSFEKQRANKSWEITPRHTDNLLMWSRMAKPVLGASPSTARSFLNQQFLFSEQELQTLGAALVNPNASQSMPTSIRQKLENFNFATNNRIPISEVVTTQVFRYTGSNNDQVKTMMKNNAKILEARLKPPAAAPALPKQSDLVFYVNKADHRHSANRAVDTSIRTASGQMANNPVPSPVSGEVIYNSAVSGQVAGHGHVVVIRASSGGNGYKAGDRILISHGSRVVIRGNRVTAGQTIMLTGGPGTTTGNADPGVIHIQRFQPGPGAFPLTSEQYKNQADQNSFVRGAMFPLFQRKVYPNNY